MKRLTLAAVPLLLIVAFAPLARGQQALERLERRLAEEDAGGDDSQPAPRGAAAPGYLGAVTDDRQDRGRGVRVVEVVENGPADVAGLLPQDLITAIDGQAVRGMADVAHVIRRTPAGRTLKLDVDRQGAKMTMDVKLGPRPPAGERRFRDFGRIPDEAAEPALGPARPADAPRAELGITARAVDETIRERLRLPSARGVLVAGVAAGSPAEQAGIPLDAVIVAADGQPLDRPADLAEVVRGGEPGQEIELSYLFDGKLVKATVQLAAVEAEADVPPPPVAEPDPAARIEALERRVQELEQRIEGLEAALRNER